MSHTKDNSLTILFSLRLSTTCIVFNDRNTIESNFCCIYPVFVRSYNALSTEKIFAFERTYQNTIFLKSIHLQYSLLTSETKYF